VTHPAPNGTGRLAVLAGTLLPGDGRAPIPDALVLAQGDRITWVGRRSEGVVPADAVVVDASDGWVLPGLVEGHAHITSFASPAYHPDAPPPFHDAPLLLEAFARWGVTTIRDTGGPELGALRTLQTHTGPWPRLFGSGPNLDGNPGGPWKGMWKSDDPAEAVEFVAREAEAGVDFVKVYAWMTPEVLAAVVEASHRRGLKVAGHVGHLVSAREAVRLGVDALEHVRVGRELLDEAGQAAWAALPTRPRDEMSDTRPWRFIDPDGAAVDELLGFLVEHGTWLTPTLAVHEAIAGGHGHDHDTSPEITAAIQLHRDATSAKAEKSADDERWGHVEFDRICRFVARAHEAGVRICAGSDTPSGSVAPGSGVHRELELLVAAGIAPAEAIRSATSRTAELLGQTPHLGSVTPGTLADLLVLDADPLADISATRSIRTVLLAGRQVHTAAVPA
jgi:imidazolonepropionase-like amidohydrolase